MGQFDRQTATALKLIKKYGGPCTINEAVDPAANPDEPWNPVKTAPIAHTSIPICFVPVNTRQYRKAQLISGTEVPLGFETALIGRLDFELGLKDIIVRANGWTYQIRDFDAIDPNGEGVILYEVLVQR